MGGYSRLWQRVVVSAHQATLADGDGLVEQPYAGVDYITHSATKNLAFWATASILLKG
jgi:hypothetical protein